MDQRNESINNQINKNIEIIQNFGLNYVKPYFDLTLENKQLFELLSEENKNLKNIVTKITKINELINKYNTIVDDSIILDMNLYLDLIIESLNEKIKNLSIKKVVVEEEIIEEPKNTINTITNMEDIKRAFFNKKYDEFNTLIKAHNFSYYIVNYKYSSINDNKPDYMAKNLVGGFVRTIEDFSKYFLICFRCYKNGNNFDYPSLWISNIDPEKSISDVIGEFYDDFDFTKVDDPTQFLIDLKKKQDLDENLLIEKYVH